MFLTVLESFLQYWELIILFILIATLYSSVGFGGGSSYLAILAISGLVFTEMRTIALLCNIVVVLTNVLFFLKEKVYNFKKIIPLVSCSVPFAFLGGLLKITSNFFFILLGITLFFAAITMWFSEQIQTSNLITDKNKIHKETLFGSGIGFLSGMVGIGGGIFLAPLLHLTQWGSPKKIAATASLFILVNSISGLFGQMVSFGMNFNWSLIFILVISVFIGGQLGNILRNRLFSPQTLKKATAVLIAYISFTILFNI